MKKLVLALCTLGMFAALVFPVEKEENANQLAIGGGGLHIRT